jgi:uncharacterized membrane protein YedE/YeeE
LALTLSYLFSDKAFGATPAYAYLAKAIGLLIHDRGLLALDALGRYELRPHWFQTFALGIPLGALLAAFLFNDFKWQAVPPLWRARFGPSAVKRGVVAFLGGAIAMIGVRLAMGCPSGLGLSGMVELSLSGFLGFAVFFAGGAIMALVLYPRQRKVSGGGS